LPKPARNFPLGEFVRGGCCHGILLQNKFFNFVRECRDIYRLGRVEPHKNCAGTPWKRVVILMLSRVDF
jgi:hypothetical protein